MRKFYKSSVLLYLNLITLMVFLIAIIISANNLNKTNVHLGFDLYLIVLIMFIVFSLPFLLRVIIYILTPKNILTVHSDHIIINYKRKQQIIYAANLLGVSRISGNFFTNFGLQIGSLKIMLYDNQLPIIIRYLDDVDEVYEILTAMIRKRYKK